MLEVVTEMSNSSGLRKQKLRQSDFCQPRKDSHTVWVCALECSDTAIEETWLNIDTKHAKQTYKLEHLCMLNTWTKDA